MTSDDLRKASEKGDLVYTEKHNTREPWEAESVLSCAIRLRNLTLKHLGDGVAVIAEARQNDD